MDLEEREQPPAKFVEDIFPLEIWREIFSYLRSPADLISVTQTSQVWFELLNPVKVFPLIFPSLSSEDVLNYHGDPRWSEAVEHFFKFLPAHYDIRISSKSPTFPKHPLFKRFTIQELRQLLDNSATNPFALTRYLCYREDIRHSLCKREQEEVFSERTTLIQLVEKFGDQKLPETHAKLKNCLVFVRNNGKFMTEPGDANLGGLVRLSTNVDGILSHDGLVVNSCLKQLQAEALQPNLEMSKLEHLYTQLYTEVDLQHLKHLKSPLKAVKLEARYCISEVTLSEVFGTLAHFASTLRDFSFEYYMRDGEETVLGLKLTLPMLLKFQLNVGNHRLESVDFLLPCVSLERLIVQNCGSFSDNYRTGRGLPVIQFMGFESTMYNSNIWKHLPKLKVVEVNDRTETFNLFLLPVPILLEIMEKMFCFVCLDGCSSSRSISEGGGASNIFWKFVQDYLKLSNPVGVDDFDYLCGKCEQVISSVCQLYLELRGIQLRLSWKLGELGKLLEGSRGSPTPDEDDSKDEGAEVLLLVTEFGMGGDSASHLAGVRNLLTKKCAQKAGEFGRRSDIPPTVDGNIMKAEARDTLSASEHFDTDCEPKEEEDTDSEDVGEEDNQLSSSENEWEPSRDELSSSSIKRKLQIPIAKQKRIKQQSKVISSWSCELCGPVTTDNLSLHLHKHEQETPSEEKLFKCWFCYKSFALRQSVSGHARSAHSKMFSKDGHFICQVENCLATQNQNLSSDLSTLWENSS
ncbi:PR domain zinc finger protein 16 [Orchesella cincta]|uniref:PR domain zinc finger protein 16 n=1 Tax=Orchesella cincta TaxID=48709 RepID=A0A1D2MK23_ORCCI|nr:PR domain zinc finger protein 16 [Orchesella cincta]